MFFDASGSGVDVHIQMKILRDSTVIWDEEGYRALVSSSVDNSILITIALVNSPKAGTHTYKMQMKNHSGNETTNTARQRSLIAFGAKK